MNAFPFSGVYFYKMYRGRKTDGFTLVECTLVVAILSIVATLAVVRLSGRLEQAHATAAANDLACLRDAFLSPETGYIRDLRGIPGFSVGFLRVANLLMPTNLYGAVASPAALTTGLRVDDETSPVVGAASPASFVRWNPESARGWRGPYVASPCGVYPARDARRFADDETALARGFFPRLSGLREPDDFLVAKDDCSIYGFPGEPAVLDPWGNPYVLQIPPPQAFPGASTNLPDEVRFRFARVVSAGPDGRLDTPCFGVNRTNSWTTSWTERERRLARQAGRIDGADVSRRGDDLVLFLNRADIDEGRLE